MTVVPGPPTGRELASVESAPLMERLRQMMVNSDNVMAESIGREVAAESQRPLSFAGAAGAVSARLAGEGIDMTGAKLLDSSGLSVDNRLTAITLDEVIGEAAAPTTANCVPCWTCWRSPAVPAPCRIGSCRRAPPAPRRAGCGPRPVR